MIRRKRILLIAILLIFTTFILNAEDKVIRPGDEKNEEEIVQESQKDLAAILQWSVKYRFSPNLKVGDKVEYKLIADPENKTDISLEVTKRDKNGVWILEQFDDNKIYMLVDLDNMVLLDFYGYDEDMKIPNPPMLSDSDLEKRIGVLNEFRKGLSGFGIPQNWDIRADKENIRTKSGNIECSVIQPKFDKKTTNKMKENKIAEELVNKLKLYFNDDVPKLIPFEIAKYAIGCPNIYRQIPGGFVKNSVIELKEYNK